MYFERFHVLYEVENRPKIIGGFRLIGTTITSFPVTKDFPSLVTDISYTLEEFCKGNMLDKRIFYNWNLLSGAELPLKPYGYFQRIKVLFGQKDLVERLVIGRRGEVYFTANHYQSFVKLHSKEK